MALAGTKYHPETLLFLTAELTSHLTPPSHGTNKRDALNQRGVDLDCNTIFRTSKLRSVGDNLK